MSFTYKTITETSNAEFKDRGSRFIAYAFPVETTEQIKLHLKAIKEMHPKAVHHCLAWRLGHDQNQFRASDDGEPSGSAGKPILGQLDSMELTNCLVVVVRYFGGVLLGVPGLIHAYRSAAAMALEQNRILEKNKEVLYKLQFDYTLMNEVMRIVKQFEITIKKQEMLLFCVLEIGVPLGQHESILAKFHDLRTLQLDKIH